MPKKSVATKAVERVAWALESASEFDEIEDAAAAAWSDLDESVTGPTPKAVADMMEALVGFVRHVSEFWDA